jgi:hypothetical protein
MSVTHSKVSSIPDDPAAALAGEVLPSDWNATHTVSLADGDIPASIARDTEVTAAVAAEATLARNADNLSSGTVADARIASTIARDSEVTSAVSAEATARDAAIETHRADTTAVHGITDTSALYVAGGTDVAVADGGTGASTAANARTNLGLVIGTDVRAQASGDPTRASLGLATSDSPEFAALNVGAAADTTITRTGAGDIAVEGNAIYRAGGTDVPVADGGTGASTAANARTNLGLVIGTDVQAQDAELAAIAGLTSAANKGIQFTGSGTAATFDLTTAGKALLDDNDAAAQLVTLGVQTAINATKIDDLTAGDDNTDLNVSTSKHGLTPKLPNDATKYLDGTGAYSVPPGTAGTFKGSKISRQAAQSLTSGVVTDIDMDTEDYDTDTMHYTSAAALTGTVAKTASSAAIVGSSTLFLSELAVGQVISIPGTAAEKRVVTAIADDTHLTVNANLANTASGQTATRVRSAIVFRTAGYYTVHCRMGFATNSTADRIGQLLYQTGTTAAAVIAGASSNPITNNPLAINFTEVFNFAQWDFVILQGYQLSGGALNTATTVGYYPRLAVTSLGT